jgi:hypothetical protein
VYADFCKDWPGHLALAFTRAAQRRYAARPTGPHPDPVAYAAADADMRRISAKRPMTWERLMASIGARRSPYPY